MRYLTSLVVMAMSGIALADDARVDFVRDVQPILAARCYTCHGPDKQKAQLRFDSRESVFAGGLSGPTLLAGHADQSRIIHRVLGLDGDDRMPLKDKPLSDEQIALLKRWIDQGADFPESASVAGAVVHRHWAYVKPAPAALPDVKDTAWCRNAIDRFIEAKLQSQGLHHSPPADRATLIRRVSLDLVGIPPTVAEVDAFVNDNSPDAYEKLVDRLLASPHYGERWAIPWLDLARYADSDGYERDPLRSMWPYRDWVINALNRNMPFDEFTIEQLAGDLLPNATEDQKIATGFHRNTLINHEAGSDQGEYFYYALVDRVNTTGTVWLGTTMACSQCHNHKYDPFTQRDFYKLMAFFNGTADEARQVGGSEIEDISPKLTIEQPGVQQAREELAVLRHQMDEKEPQLAEAQRQWEQSLAVRAEWTPLTVKQAESSGAASLVEQSDGSILAGGLLPANDTYTVIAETQLQHITAIELELLPDDTLPNHGPGRAPNGNLALTHFSMTASAADGSACGRPTIFPHATADFSQQGWPVEHAVSDKPDVNTGWAIMPSFGKRHAAIFQTSSDVGFEGGTVLTFKLEHNSQFPQHMIGRFRLWATDSPRSTFERNVPEKIARLVDVAPADRTPQQANELASYYRSIAPEIAPLRDRIAELEKQIAAGTATTLVMKELPKPRETHIHVRGGYLTLGEKVDPGIPAIFTTRDSSASFDDPRRQTRLDLARWLVGPDNPLTARVTMNRLWEQYFGTGIVKTSEDFGTQGDPPADQPLLDYLACEFQNRHWDLKQMHRLIVTSATYQQCSDVSSDVAEKDPDNRLLARGPRFRLPAELLRDQALAISGLLSGKIGGPSVFPLQPDGVWRNPYSGSRWDTSAGENRWRRGVYTFIRRSTPYPQFIAFDSTAHEGICPRRPRTNTPLQALTAMNDPVFVQAAAALARRSIKQGGDSRESRIEYLFRSAVSRKPDETERKRLVELHDQLLKEYQNDRAAAEKMADSGLPDRPKDIDPADLAAYTVVANTVLNLDEVLSKE